VEGAAWRIEPESPAKKLHVPQNVSTSQLRLSAVGKEQMVYRSIRFLAVADNRLSQLKAERDNPLLSPLAVQRDKQILKVQFGDMQGEGL
jgi:hypothetical protein